MASLDRATDRAYLLPLPAAGDPPVARGLGGARLAFAEVLVLRRGHRSERLPIDAAEALVPDAALAIVRAAAMRAPLAGVAMDRPRIMGIVNVTPDSFSDGGRLADAQAAIEHALGLAEAGADILDIGGESTRPGAEPIGEAEERARVLPVIEGLMAAGCRVPVSVDTRKAAIARDALAAGATLFNDVSALTHDPQSLSVATTAPALCLMHARGDPQTMQNDPHYPDVLLDVYDYLSERVATAESAGITRDRMAVDPGIGFGKTLEHNLALLAGLPLFLTLGCPLLVGVSRKRFIGTLSGVAEAADRVAGSVAAALHAAGKGAHILRVHDVRATREALDVWSALHPPRRPAMAAPPHAAQRETERR